MTLSDILPVIKRSAIGGVLCAVVFLPIMYLALNAYVIVTISVGPVTKINRLIDFALVAGSLAAFFAGFVSNLALGTVSTGETQ
ncbi:MAG: hypothetical protein ABEH86_01375 [Haloarcula sp.]